MGRVEVIGVVDSSLKPGPDDIIIRDARGEWGILELVGSAGAYLDDTVKVTLETIHPDGKTAKIPLMDVDLEDVSLAAIPSQFEPAERIIHQFTGIREVLIDPFESAVRGMDLPKPVLQMEDGSPMTRFRDFADLLGAAGVRQGDRARITIERL